MNGENELPEGWISVILEDYIYIAARIGWRGLKRSEYTSSGPLLLAVKDIQENGLIDYNGISDHLDDFRYDESPEIQLKENDVLITKDGTIGKIGYVHNLSQKATTNSSILVVRPCNAIDTKYLFYYFRSPFFQRIVQEKITGSAVPHLFQKDIKKFEVFIPPLAEQRRIVAAVEALLARVNASRERLDRVPGLLKAFRQAVLAAACSGRLTEGWREENQSLSPKSDTLIEKDSTELKKKNQKSYIDTNIVFPKLPDSWKYLRIGEINEFIGSGITPRGGKSCYQRNKGIPFIRSQNVYPDGLHLDDIVFISQELHNKMVRTHTRPNDVLLNITGASIGRSTFIPFEIPIANVNQHVCIIRTDGSILPKYLSIFLNSQIGQDQIFKLQGGQTREGLNYPQVRSIKVSFPPLAEQHEIVYRIKTLFALADSIEQRMAAGKERVDRLTQAILAKAFHGELVPTEAELARREGREYEPASVLLERIRRERESQGEMKPRKRKIRSEKGGE